MTYAVKQWLDSGHVAQGVVTISLPFGVVVSIDARIEIAVPDAII
jgi:hypothetical protein